MKYGYIRVSTEDQKEDRQLDALEAICDEIAIEKLSAVSAHRPKFDQLITSLNEGDTLVVLDLDRAFRSTVDAVTQAEQLRKRGANLQIVNLSIDTNTPAGELVYTMMAAAAQFERRLTIQRIHEGLTAAKKRGVKLGRPKKLTSEDLDRAKLLIEHGERVRDIAPSFKVHWRTLMRALNA